MSTINGHTTRATGTILTAAIYNADHVNHVNNALALNADKIEGANPPVVDGYAVVFDGTGGNAFRSAAHAPGDMLRSSNLSGMGNSQTSFDNIKQPATETYVGAIEQATVAEIRASTAGNFAITPAGVKAASALVALTDQAAVDINWDSGINFTWTIGGNRTLNNPSNGQPGTWRQLILTQDGTGSRTITWGNQYRFNGGTDPVISTAANAVDTFAIFCRTAGLFDVYPMGRGMAT